MEQPSTQPLPAPLYSYLKTCALEKRGQHRLSDIDLENERDGCSDDTAFLMQFVDDMVQRESTDSDTIAFLEEVRRSLLGVVCTVKVHVTRDYQVIETGNHYAKLLFRIVQQSRGYVNNIKFYVKFRMNPTYDGLEDTDHVHVVYSRDHVKASQPNTAPRTSTHTIVVHEDLTYSREHVASSQLHVGDPVLRNTAYLIPESYVPQPDMSVEACTICRASK